MPLDKEGRISKYLKSEIDRNSLADSFAVLNKNQMIYELHVLRNDSVPVVIYYDLKVGQFTIGKDVRASYITEIIDDANNPIVYIGTNNGYIVNEDSSGGTYKPSSGTTKTTITGVDLANNTITVSASDLQITEAGLVGNTIHIISGGIVTRGSVFKGVIKSNTNATITFLASEEEFVFGSPFTPAIGDTVYIGGIGVRWKTPAHYFTSPQDQLEINTISSAVNAFEPVHFDIIHNRSSSTSDCYLAVYRDGISIPAKFFPVPTTNEDFSRVQLISHTRGRFAEFELFHIDETEEFEIIGYSIGINIDEGVISGAS
jgi:hypothetical protein